MHIPKQPYKWAFGPRPIAISNVLSKRRESDRLNQDRNQESNKFIQLCLRLFICGALNPLNVLACIALVIKQKIQFFRLLGYMGLIFLSPFTLLSEKLVNQETGRTIIEFSEESIQFGDCFLEEEMIQTGIYIPLNRKNDFDGKEIVYPNDLLFEKAFTEVYCPLYLTDSLYQWQNERSTKITK